jgi:muramoyltetrapeptide carboxypeptidase
VAQKLRTQKSRAQHGWLPLVPGDIVDIVAPASATTSKDGLAKGIEYLRKWGLVPRMNEAIFGRDVICANTDEERFAQLRAALFSDSRAIWCVRGGYGANRLIPELARLRRPKGPPKLFMGFSDITTLHVFLNQQWGWPTIHGPMVDRIGRGLILEPQLQELHDIYFGDEAEIVFRDLKPMNAAARASGGRGAGGGRVIRAPVTGGNLVTLQSTIGTRAPWDTRGRIVFLEEIDERGYRIDRLLEHLAQTGHFSRARAVILGDFLGGVESDGSTRVPFVLQRFADSLKIPVLSGVEAGHGDLQRPIPLETMATLTCGASGGSIAIASGCDLRGDRERERAGSRAGATKKSRGRK